MASSSTRQLGSLIRTYSAQHERVTIFLNDGRDFVIDCSFDMDTFWLPCYLQHILDEPFQGHSSVVVGSTGTRWDAERDHERNKNTKLVIGGSQRNPPPPGDALPHRCSRFIWSDIFYLDRAIRTVRASVDKGSLASSNHGILNSLNTVAGLICNLLSLTPVTWHSLLDLLDLFRDTIMRRIAHLWSADRTYTLVRNETFNAMLAEVAPESWRDGKEVITDIATLADTMGLPHRPPKPVKSRQRGRPRSLIPKAPAPPQPSHAAKPPSKSKRQPPKTGQKRKRVVFDLAPPSALSAQEGVRQDHGTSGLDSVPPTTQPAEPVQEARPPLSETQPRTIMRVERDAEGGGLNVDDTKEESATGDA